MDFKIIDIFALLILNLQFACSENILSCNVTHLPSCGKNQICMGTIKECVCLDGFVRKENECVEPSSAVTADRHTTTVVVSIFTTALILVGLGLVIRKYKLVEYVSRKINLRRNNDVMYEDVMIGQDDPPLVP